MHYPFALFISWASAFPPHFPFALLHRESSWHHHMIPGSPSFAVRVVYSSHSGLLLSIIIKRNQIIPQDRDLGFPYFSLLPSRSWYFPSHIHHNRRTLLVGDGSFNAHAVYYCVCVCFHNTVIKQVLRSPQTPVMQTIIREREGGYVGGVPLYTPRNAVQTLRKFCLCPCLYMCVLARSGFVLCWMLAAAEQFPDVGL